MSHAAELENDPRSIGDAAIRALADMNIPPEPPFYQVWFAHLLKKNEELSSEIEKKLSSDDHVDEYFLKDIHKKYFELAQPAKKIEKYTESILHETTILNKIASAFGTSTEELKKDLAGVAKRAGNEPPSMHIAEELICSLAAAADKAMERNTELEKDLNKASDKINALQQSIEIIATDANTDFLTKINNRRYFDKAVRTLIADAREEKTPLCLIVADIDHFKKFNDKWGHQVGDQVLKLVADVMRENVKGQDLLARYGGEEFALALPNTSLADAATLAENIRIAVGKRKLINKATNVNLGRVTMSFGVSDFQPSVSPEALFAAADAALYQAKNEGRNRVAVRPAL